MAPSHNESGGGGITLDELFTVLRRPAQRRILTALREQPSYDREELVTVRRDGTDPDRFEVQLYHDYLPSLDEIGVIEWDHEADTITRGANFESVASFFAVMDENQERSPYDWP